MQRWRILPAPDNADLVSVAGDRRHVSRLPPPEGTFTSMDDMGREVLTKILEDNCVSEPAEMQEIERTSNEVGNTMFRTGSGRAVLMSKSSIEKAKSLFESNTDEVYGIRHEQFPMLQNGSVRPVSTSMSSIHKEKAFVENHDIDRGARDGTAQIPIFQTGLGRPVSVKQSSVEKTRAFFEIENTDGGILDGISQFQIFQTGSGRPVSVKRSSLVKARAVLEDDQKEEGIVGSGDKPLFQTGLGRPVSVNQSSINKARLSLENGKNEELIGNIPLFHTGSGRPVSVNQNSIHKARTVFENHISEEIIEDIPLFQTVLGRPVSANQNSIKKGRAVLENHKNEEVHEDASLFQTGSGRPVSVSEIAIHKARSVLDNEKNAKVYRDIPMLETRSLNKDSIHKPRAILENYKSEEKCGGIPMFETGSGRPVSASANSIQKARAFWQNGKNEERCEDIPMFETGSGRPVSVSKNSIQKARTRLQNDKSEQMFETASGRAVSVSKNSIQKARALLENEKKGEAKMQMFQTGLGKPVPVSENSIKKAKRLLEAGNNTKLGTRNEDLPLFQTGLGRPVLISETSINKARAVFETKNEELHGEINTKQTHMLTNLQKTPLKSAKFHSEGISRATTLLGLDENDVSATQIFNHTTNNNDNGNLIVSQIESHRDPCQGLQRLSTASGRPILVSNDALNRAKSLLGNPNLENGIFFNEEILERGPNSALNRAKSLLGNPNSGNEMFQRKESKDLHVIKGNNNVIIESGPSIESSNEIGKGNDSMFVSKKRKISRVSPFKRPRSSRFVTPLNNSASFIPPGPSSLTKLQNGCQKTRVSTRYPFQRKRKTLKELFGPQPSFKNYENIPDEIKKINSDNAENFVFRNEPIKLGFEFDLVGSDEFRDLLIQSGATSSHATKEWVSNHYKWIVWKLACYERFYAIIPLGKYLTVSNVLEELKYRYEREANHGHRSAIKKILDGDASSSSMMILCISKIISKIDDSISNSSNDSISKHETNPTTTAKIILTDGWYSLEASLDVLLTKQLFAKKIFVGQKFRICGASLCGWVGPISFLEANGAVSLSLHINGTYRANWDEPLGFCKKIGPPLAFNCIKSSGGMIPLTLVGISRIYPLLYKERLSNGGSIARSERMEQTALQLYHQRRNNIAEDIISKQQEISSNSNSSDNCEGAKISKIIERSAEPEVLLAGMTSEQLHSLSSYQTKQMEMRQGEMGKRIEQALQKAGLGSRDVSPFMKLRIVGLNCKNSSKKGRNMEGLITIWNPTDKQKMELVEGKMYRVMGLVPLFYGGDILYLQARGSSTIWNPLPSLQSNHFEPFFTPRIAVQLCNLGEVPLASEFDIAGVILLVGDIYYSDQQKKQWVFITDGSRFEPETHLEDTRDSILAVNFFMPLTHDEDASLKLFNHTLQGSTVGFLNLIKRARDQSENIWIAEATEYSTYSLSSSLNNSSHLKEAAKSAEKWAKTSQASIERLRERVSCLMNC